MEFVVLVGAASGTVANMTAQEWIGPDSDLSIPGVCLAKAQLFGTLDAVSGSIPLAVETPIWSATVQPGEVIAKLFEFDLQNPSSTVTVRTVAKLPGSSNGDFTDPVAADDVLVTCLNVLIKVAHGAFDGMDHLRYTWLPNDTQVYNPVLTYFAGT